MAENDKLFQSQVRSSSAVDEGVFLSRSEPPPAYSEKDNSLPSSSAAPWHRDLHPVQSELLEFQWKIYCAINRSWSQGTVKHSQKLQPGTDAETQKSNIMKTMQMMDQLHISQREPEIESPSSVFRQTLHLMDAFIAQISQDYPKVKDKMLGHPGDGNAKPTAYLYVALREEVSEGDGWHLSTTSLKDEQLRGMTVQHGTIWRTELEQDTADFKEQLAKWNDDSPFTRGDTKRSWDKPDTYTPEWASAFWSDEQTARHIGLEVSRRFTLPELHDRREVDDQNRPVQYVTVYKSALVQVRLQPEFMTFRRQNPFGLWESKSGWTLQMEVLFV